MAKNFKPNDYNKYGVQILEIYNQSCECTCVCPVCKKVFRRSFKFISNVKYCSDCGILKNMVRSEKRYQREKEIKQLESDKAKQEICLKHFDDTQGNAVPTPKELTERIFRNFMNRNNRDEIDEIALSRI